MMIFKVSLFLHVLAAIFWIGGMLFLSLVVAPFLKSLDDPAKKSEIYQVVGKRYRFLGWVAIVILLLTGPVNFYYIGVTPGMFLDAGFYGTPYGKTAALKLLFVCLIASACPRFFGPARGRRVFAPMISAGTFFHYSDIRGNASRPEDVAPAP